jgi:hypothetical protein
MILLLLTLFFPLITKQIILIYKILIPMAITTITFPTTIFLVYYLHLFCIEIINSNDINKKQWVPSFL